MPEQCHQVTGELDFATAPALRAQLMPVVMETQDDLVLDCERLSFIDSSGVTVFASVYSRLVHAGRGFRLANLRGNPRRVVELGGLVDLLCLDGDGR